MVLVKFPLTHIVSWEASIRSALPWNWVEGKWLAHGTAKAAFLASIMKFGLDTWRTMFAEGWSACDGAAELLFGFNMPQGYWDPTPMPAVP
jgi:hypothetical protein